MKPMDVQSSCRLSFESLNSTNELSIFYRVHLFISSPGEVDSLEHIHSLFNLFLHSLIRVVTVWNIYKVTPYNNVFTCILNHCLTMNTHFSSNTELGLCLSVCQSPSKDHNCFWLFNKSDNWPSEANSCMTLIITDIKCQHNGSKVNSSSRGDLSFLQHVI